MRIARLKCIACGAEYPADRLMNLCPEDGRPVEVILDLERLLAEQPDLGWYHPERRDMWRFGSLLPLDIADPADRGHIVSLGEGCTPLLDYRRHPLAHQGGFDLWIKDEGAAHPGYGSNPTLSFKDRGMAMTVSMAPRAAGRPDAGQCRRFPLRICGGRRPGRRRGDARRHADADPRARRRPRARLAGF
jgi:threonine synthase